MRNCFLAIIVISLVSCTPAESVPPRTVVPNPTDTLVSPMQTPTPTATSALPQPDAGWKTFVSTHLQVAVDYPPGWAVNEQVNGVSFTSTAGIVIRLARIETGGRSPEEFLRDNQIPNTRCSSSLNNYGIKLLVCLDTLLGSYSANFVMALPQGPTQLLSLTMLRKGDLQVFDRMVASIRPSTRP